LLLLLLLLLLVACVLLLLLACVLQLTDPFLQLFRGIVPPIGGIDLSVSPAAMQQHHISGSTKSSSSIKNSA
jgi:uncharacterized protein YggT (Ycf19 family)